MGPAIYVGKSSRTERQSQDLCFDCVSVGYAVKAFTQESYDKELYFRTRESVILFT